MQSQLLKVDFLRSYLGVPGSKLCYMGKCLQAELIPAQDLLNEGNERLQKGLKRKDFKEINVASAMIESANSKVKELTTKLGEAQGQNSNEEFACGRK